mmetsp:Transcript_33082/g.79017  ORF Transcript_33082/g.79017 Transcript_33082/m.79017 type:complete len:259 (+) Transcript_33082:2361-3137(+)
MCELDCRRGVPPGVPAPPAVEEHQAVRQPVPVLGRVRRADVRHLHLDEAPRRVGHEGLVDLGLGVQLAPVGGVQRRGVRRGHLEQVGRRRGGGRRVLRAAVPADPVRLGEPAVLRPVPRDVEVPRHRRHVLRVVPADPRVILQIFMGEVRRRTPAAGHDRHRYRHRGPRLHEQLAVEGVVLPPHVGRRAGRVAERRRVAVLVREQDRRLDVRVVHEDVVRRVSVLELHLGEQTVLARPLEGAQHRNLECLRRRVRAVV